MFAGKTEELLRRVRRAQIAGLRVEVFGHVLDTRRGSGSVSSHAGQSVPSRTVEDSAGLEALVAEAGGLDLVAIDEAHFFGLSLVPVAQRLADRGLVVIVSGLDVTFDAEPFEPLPALAALAERVEKLTAICTVCGGDAAFHERAEAVPSQDEPRSPARSEPAFTPTARSNSQTASTPPAPCAAQPPSGASASSHELRPEHVGGADLYQARCRDHLRAAPWRAREA